MDATETLSDIEKAAARCAETATTRAGLLAEAHDLSTFVGLVSLGARSAAAKADAARTERRQAAARVTRNPGDAAEAQTATSGSRRPQPARGPAVTVESKKLMRVLQTLTDRTVPCVMVAHEVNALFDDLQHRVLPQIEVRLDDSWKMKKIVEAHAQLVRVTDRGRVQRAVEGSLREIRPGLTPLDRLLWRPACTPLAGLVANLEGASKLLKEIHGRASAATKLRAGNEPSAASATGPKSSRVTGAVRVDFASSRIPEIERALDRSLRGSFKRKPANERAVQDAVATILRAIGLDFTREQETAPVASRAFKPDFVAPSDDLAIEIKLATTKHSESQIQDEIAGDVSAYRTKWAHLLVVIYDCGVIKDPVKMRAENLKKLGVHALVIKH